MNQDLTKEQTQECLLLHSAWNDLTKVWTLPVIHALGLKQQERFNDLNCTRWDLPHTDQAGPRTPKRYSSKNYSTTFLKASIALPSERTAIPAITSTDCSSAAQFAGSQRLNGRIIKDLIAFTAKLIGLYWLTPLIQSLLMSSCGTSIVLMNMRGNVRRNPALKTACWFFVLSPIECEIPAQASPKKAIIPMTAATPPIPLEATAPIGRASEIRITD